jgi:hypothetical protein
VQDLELYVGSGKCLVDISQRTSLEKLEVNAADGFAEGSALPACAPVVILNDMPLPERPWQLLAGVQQLEIAWLYNKAAGAVAQLSRLQSLTSLSLSCPCANDAAAAAVEWKCLTQLRSLHVSIVDHAEMNREDLSKCEDTVRAISMVKGLTNLRIELPVRTTLPWAVHVAHLKDLHNLAVFHANSSREDMLQLKKLTQLTALVMYGCSMDDAVAVAVLGRLTNLQSLKLDLSFTVPQKEQMSDAVVPVLEQLKSLRELSLGLPGVGERSLVLLEGLTQLTRLGVRLTPESQRHLGRVLGCSVSYPW